MEGIKVDGLTCPACGGDLFFANTVEKGLYVCVSKKADGIICDHVQCFCKGCSKIRDQSEFGKHGDVWECKECGTICWPYTDRMRSKEQAEDFIKKTDGFLSSLYKW